MTSTTAHLTNAAMKRRDFIEDALGTVGSVLEIGAFDNPTFRREMDDNVKYVDWFSREELVKNHRGNSRRDFDRIVEIDFVVKHNRLSEAVGEKCDLICANHVIEHIPDVIQWLAELSAMLKDGGRVFLAVPDKRFTFDHYRSPSAATDMIRAHHEKLTKPSKWQLLDQLYYHQKIDAAEIWAGKRAPKFRPRWSLARAMEMAEEKARQYTDCHCWTFAAGSFPRVISDLASAELCDFSIEVIRPPQRPKVEFHTLLKKTTGVA